MQHVGEDRRHGDRGQVGEHEDPAEPLAQHDEQPDVDHGGHQRHEGEAAQPLGHGGRCVDAGLGGVGGSVGPTVVRARARRDRARRAGGEDDRQPDAEHGEGVRDPLDGLAPVGELDVLVGGDHHHEVGRHPVGPSAPSTCQLGKYDAFTSTGAPGAVDVEGDAVGADLDVRAPRRSGTGRTLGLGVVRVDALPARRGRTRRGTTSAAPGPGTR